MPPKKRQKLMRIDAALDAMRPLGFPDSLVRKTVRVLLKEYGGNESWGFIEEAAYRVLIDALLDIQQEDKDEEEGLDVCVKEECNGEAGGLVQNEENGETRERVDQHLDLVELGVVDEDVCQQNGVHDKNHLSPKAKNFPTGFGEGHVDFASTCTPPVVDCTLAIRKPCYGWISDDD